MVVPRISRFLAWTAGLIILVSALMISADVVTRSLLRVTFLESVELSAYAFAISVTFGLSYTLISKSHIRIEVVYSLFTLRTRVVLDLVAIALLTAGAVTLTWFASETVLFSYQFGARSNTSLGLPLVIPQGLWFAGLVWFAITALWLTVSSLIRAVLGQRSRVAHDIGILSLEEELSLSSVDAGDVAKPIDGKSR